MVSFFVLSGATSAQACAARKQPLEAHLPIVSIAWPSHPTSWKYLVMSVSPMVIPLATFLKHARRISAWSNAKAGKSSTEDHDVSAASSPALAVSANWALMTVM
eukprot:CAMPEP_0115437076 /NCGR_PEP_ID=MMETSP0271-20121206/34546_1 /TAXON_ID=71861 /ORGANISM="Scrippsiella trochoidea, Strain CCMP3099" /LENGTH=103 /DNA_ID=CAMNT_0002862669 /DNA_START=88 /DNA_END=399 /DNA_ORIENTATION=-